MRHARIALFLVLLAASSRGFADETSRSVSFRDDIVPLLVRRCWACHTAETREGGYAIETYQMLSAAGDSGETAVVPGKPMQSELWRRVISSAEDVRMPLDGPALDAAAVEKLRAWIAGGAVCQEEDRDVSLVRLLPVRRYPASPDVYARPVPITAMAIEGESLLVSGYHELLRWQWKTPQLQERIPQVGERVYALAHDVHRQRLVVGSGTPGRWGEVRILDESARLLGVPLTTDDVVLDLSVAPRGNQLAVSGADGRVHVLDLETLRVQGSLDAHADWVHAVAWGPDSNTVVSASRDRTAKVFHVAEGRVLATFSGHHAPVVDVRPLPGSKPTYLSGDIDGQFHVWDQKAEKPLRTLPQVGRPGRGVMVTPQGHTWILSGKVIAQIRDNQVSQRLPGPSVPPTAWALSDDGSWLATGDARAVVRVWDLSRGTLRRQFVAQPLSAKKFSSGGERPALEAIHGREHGAAGE